MSKEEFRIYDYDIRNDTFGWKTYTRDSLVADVVCSALAKAYGKQEIVRTSTLITRAVQAGLTPNEASTVSRAWADVWSKEYHLASERAGNAHFLSAPCGTYIDPATRADLTQEPDFAEIKAALQPIIERWAELPEPAL